MLTYGVRNMDIDATIVKSKKKQQTISRTILFSLIKKLYGFAITTRPPRHSGNRHTRLQTQSSSRLLRSTEWVASLLKGR